MKKNIDEAVQIIEKFIPKKIGIIKALSREDGEGLDLLFLLKKEQAASAITYIRAVSTIIERELKLKITTNIYIEDSGKAFDLSAENGQYVDLSIPNKELREVAMAR